MQDPQSRQLADARVGILSSDWVAKVILVGCSLTIICTLSVLISSYRLTSGTDLRAISNDFRVFWAAGTLAVQGDYLAVFDMERLTAVHNVNPDDWMPWLYPPGYLFLVLPFGALSYATGFTILSVLSILAMAWAVRPFATGSRAAWAAFSLAPAYLPILLLGQNGLLWLAGLLAALAALRAERWVLAGIVIGLLTLKPQFGLLIPIALIAAGLWRTFLTAVATTVIVAVLPTLVTGIDYWTFYIQRMEEYGTRVVATMHTLDLMSGPFSLLIRLGFPANLALLLQGAVTLAAAASVFLLWRSARAGFDVKVAGLLAASFLASPYNWHYEAAIMALVGLFLLRGGVLRTFPLHLAVLALLWFGAGLQAMAIFVGLGDRHFPWAVLVTPMMVLSLALCLRQLGRSEVRMA
ncbi:MAG: DUF2029 domain-containing protein [Tabrizicola sp.]|jgi:hypothetical protein|nr:DUF2029 domain-containing protein [Tabrizicola sp.]